MIRISDILKKVQGNKGEVEKKAEEQLPPPPPTQAPEEKSAPQPALQKDSKIDNKIETQAKQGICISSSVMDKGKVFIREECLKLYEETVGLIKEVYDKARADKKITEEELKNMAAAVEKFVNQQYLDNDNILSVINLTMPDDFIYSHVVNTSILSIDIGIGLGYGRTKLVELGIACILHDIGMVKFKNLYSQQHRLNKMEYDKIKNHSEVGSEIVEQLGAMYKRTVFVVLQEHERIDGSGYPHGLKGDAINEYAKIVGLADVYEAITHARPYRDKINVFDALKQLINSKKSFERKIIKILIERVAAPYPINSCIQLSTGEKCRVVKRNLTCLLRPTVEVVIDADGERLEKPTAVDLTKYPTVYIKSCLETDDL